MSDVGSSVDSASSPSSSEEVVVHGTGVSPGIAIGTVFRYQFELPEIDPADRPTPDVKAELSLFDEALERAREQTEHVRSIAQEKLGSDGDAIFGAQKMMLRDDEFLETVRRRIREDQISAARAVSVVLDEHRQRLASSDQEYLRDRVGDLDDLERRLVRALHRGKVEATLTSNSIVTADRLTTGEVVRFGRSGMLGCVMARGGRTSHASILARAMNVPAVVGAEGVMDVVQDRDPVIVDGRRGRVIVNPSTDTLARYRRQRSKQHSGDREEEGLETEPAHTRDGVRVTLRANVEFREELERLDREGADGIGLLRTELCFLDGAERIPTEEEQVDVYREAAEATGEEGATIRLFDLGGETVYPFIDEENPALGLRGIRLLLDRPDQLLRPQVRALLRANVYGRLRVLLPMVVHLDEVERVRRIIEEEQERLQSQGLQHDEDLPVGVMVETPAVALQAKVFAEVADFFSIGTNDLTQYVLAIDRGNDFVADRYDDLHPAVLRLVRATIEAGHATDTPVVLCGEAAGDRVAIPILLGLGLDGLSVAPPQLSAVKRVIRELRVSDTKTLARSACDASTAEQVRRMTRDWLGEHVDRSSLDSDPSDVETGFH